MKTRLLAVGPRVAGPLVVGAVNATQGRVSLRTRLPCSTVSRGIACLIRSASRSDGRRPRRASRRVPVAAAITAIAVLTGCAADAGAASSPPPAASVPATPSPEQVPGSTLDASAVTAEAPDGLTLAVVIAADPGEQEEAALDAVTVFAAEHSGSLTVHHDASTPVAVDAALAERPDVIVGIGPAVVGAIDLASASHLDTSFLMLGTQLAEPTGNVIAVVWPGAEERAVFAEEELPFDGADVYAAEAVETGLAAFASELDGHVIALG